MTDYQEYSRLDAKYTELSENLKKLKAEAKADGHISQHEIQGIKRLSQKMNRLRPLIAQKAMEVTTSSEALASGNEAHFDDQQFLDKYLASVDGWVGDARDAVNTLSTLSTIPDTEAELSLKDAISVAFLLKRFDKVKTAYEAMSLLATTYEKALNSVSTAQKVTLADVILNWKAALDKVEADNRSKGPQNFKKFIADYKARTGATGDTVDEAVFANECRNYDLNYLPPIKDIERTFTDNVVATLSDGWGIDAMMTPEDGEQAGYIVITVDGETKGEDISRIKWTNQRATMNDASSAISKSIAHTYKTAAIIDLPYRIALQVVLEDDEWGTRVAHYFRKSQTPGSTAFEPRGDSPRGGYQRGFDQTQELLEQVLRTGKVQGLMGSIIS